MQDEPGRGLCFSHKMSLKERFRMLGIDHQHGKPRNTEPGTDPGISGGQWRSALPGPRPRGIIRVDKPNLAAAELWPASFAELSKFTKVAVVCPTNYFRVSAVLAVPTGISTAVNTIYYPPNSGREIDFILGGTALLFEHADAGGRILCVTGVTF